MLVIAGATGRTGRAAVESLRARSQQRVRAVVRGRRDVAELRAQGVEVIEAALDDREALVRALDGADGAYVLVPEDPQALDVHGPRRAIAEAIAHAVARCRVPHVVMLSALPAALASGNGPAADLHHAEQLLLASGAIVTVLRACWFQDNILDAVGLARTEGIYPSFFPANAPAMPSVAALDVGRLAARCLLAPPKSSEIVDVLGPAYRVDELALRLGRALGRELTVVTIPPERQRETLVGAGCSPAFADALVELFGALAGGRVAPCGDRRELCTTGLDEVLRAALPEVQR